MVDQNDVILREFNISFKSTHLKTLKKYNFEVYEMEVCIKDCTSRNKLHIPCTKQVFRAHENESQYSVN